MMRNRKKLRLQNGMYFVTICTHHKKCFFGKIVNNKMKLNVVGKIAQKYWLEIPKYYKGVKIDKFIIMPNHIHGIIEFFDVVVTEHCSVTTESCKKYGLLSKIVKSYKNVVTKEINKMYPRNNFKWQRSYYDHVIRKEESLQKIQEYIMINPSEWKKDELYKAL